MEQGRVGAWKGKPGPASESARSLLQAGGKAREDGRLTFTFAKCQEKTLRLERGLV